MADRYDLYESLSLDPSASTEELRAQLDEKLAEMRSENVPEYSGQFQETFTARQILGEDFRRQDYDAQLADDNASITIATLRELAAQPESASETTSQSAPAEPTQQEWMNQPPVTETMVTTTVTTTVPPLPENATIKDAWKRLPKFPRITASVYGVATILGYITATAAIYVGFANLNSAADAGSRDSSLGSVFGDIAEIYLSLINVGSASAFFTLGIVIALLSMFWFNKILHGRNIRALPYLVASTTPLGVGLLVMSFFVQDEMIFVCLILTGVALVAATALTLTKDMRAWFRGQKLVRTTQPAPAQGYMPQYPQGS
ncbi:MAG: molecular chaperone DnaJ [Corynebacterium sp.]|uniref:molecular chaperone DnaJ n=1 Tax=Corynebacterium sp. TaxID=1720 RepID=UPI0026DCA27F|nr:molecular chaperone DnaJ [Corynebacterium sp.]MDO5030129.1 molecular chaperone DnaJ [Corynebacterium sp.]